MRSSLIRLLLLVLVLVASSLPAGAAQKPTFQPALFCEEEYALCIVAPCEPVPSPINHQITNMLCKCDVKKGWSMGPGSCASRKPVQKNGRTWLVSTYSNDYNDTNKLTSCPLLNTSWGWCYGAPCVVDPKDPSKAVCNCPMATQPAYTLGNCDSQICNQDWSAATPKESQFANCHFYNCMKKNHPDVPVKPPAQLCSGAQLDCKDNLPCN